MAKKQKKISLVTEEGLFYEQHKDSYKRAMVLGASLVGVGASFWFFSYRINESMRLNREMVLLLADYFERIENRLSTIGVNFDYNLAQGLRQVAPKFDPTFHELQDHGFWGKLAKVPIYNYIIITGFLILSYSYIQMIRWFPPKYSFVEYK